MALRATTFYVKRAGNKKILCDTNIETVTTSSFLTLLYFHISYLASIENCGKQLSRVGRIGALASKNLGSNLFCHHQRCHWNKSKASRACFLTG